MYMPILPSRFFVVEDTVLHTSQTLVTHQSGGEERDEGLISRPIVHEFWSMASAEVLAVLRTTCVSRLLLYTVIHIQWNLSIKDLQNKDTSFIRTLTCPTYNCTLYKDAICCPKSVRNREVHHTHLYVHVHVHVTVPLLYVVSCTCIVVYDYRMLPKTTTCC